MGLCLGSEVTEEGKKAKLHSAEIDRELYEHARRDMNVVKVLLLGEDTRCLFISTISVLCVCVCVLVWLV